MTMTFWFIFKWWIIISLLLALTKCTIDYILSIFNYVEKIIQDDALQNEYNDQTFPKKK